MSASPEPDQGEAEEAFPVLEGEVPASPAAVAPPGHLVVIEPTPRSLDLGLGDLWGHREFLFFLIWRDLKVRYRQTVLGVAWAVIQPLLSMAVFTVIFGLMVRVPSQGVPYPLYVYSALLLWMLFTRVLTGSSASLVNGQALVKKVFFPRIVLPLATLSTALVDFAIGFVALLGLLAYYDVPLGPQVLMAPVFAAAAVVVALALGIPLAALNVRYRDVEQALPFLTQIWFYLSPVLYPPTLVPEKYRWIYELNPMVNIVAGFRWSLFTTLPAPAAPPLVGGMCAALILFFLGLRYFRRAESTFADLL